MSTVYIREMNMTVAGPTPGLVNLIRWLFEPFQPPPPPLPSPEEQASILLFLAEGW